jgi:hypothetical protein
MGREKNALLDLIGRELLSTAGPKSGVLSALRDGDRYGRNRNIGADDVARWVEEGRQVRGTRNLKLRLPTIEMLGQRWTTRAALDAFIRKTTGWPKVFVPESLLLSTDLAASDSPAASAPADGSTANGENAS